MRQPCRMPDCNKPSKAKQLCQRHYALMRRNGAPEPTQPYTKRGAECSVPDCLRPILARGLCNGHYSQYMRGCPFTPIRKRAKNGEGYGCIKSNGYRYVYYGGNQYRLEHRVVMEELLGRSLSKDEHVHHINGDRTDNRIENLEIWNTSHPCGQRIEDKVKHAIEILQRYAPTVLK